MGGEWVSSTASSSDSGTGKLNAVASARVLVQAWLSKHFPLNQEVYFPVFTKKVIAHDQKFDR